MNRFPLAVLSCAIVFVGAITSFAGADDRPNIVWIFVEDTNAWMGCYGDDLASTPNIDALAQRGVRFDRAYMSAGVCSATRSAMAYGVMQTTFGLHNHRSSRRGDQIHLPDDVSSVYELFRDAGYYVATQGTAKDDFNFVWDRASFYDHSGREWDYHGPTWAGREEGQPFFAQFQLSGGKVRIQPESPTDPAAVSVPPYYPDHEIIRREIAHHYDCIAHTDVITGRIIDALAEDSLLENTIVFFFTDHGMRLPRHKQFLYEGGIHVPLVVAGPGIPESAVREDLVSGIDITVTSLALAGIDVPDFMEGRDVFADDYEPREYVIAARDRCDYTIDHIRAVVTDRYKYLHNYLTDRTYMQPQYRDGRDYAEVIRDLYNNGALNDVQAAFWLPDRPTEELYDLEADPHETINLAGNPEYADVLQQHRDILESWITETDDQGQYPESDMGLRAVFRQWGAKCVNPEFDRVREAGAAANR